MEKERILVSACLLGTACRYDGASKEMPEGIGVLMEQAVLIPVCPEIMGGLSTPRVPSERVGDKVLMKDGRDVTENYKKGAMEALRIARLYGCKKAVLKEKSPSCGFGSIYDGTFSRALTKGNGVAAEFLTANGIEVFGESEWRKAMTAIPHFSGKKTIGLTGGVGSGKSRVLEILEKEYGAKVIQADLVAKELEKKGEKAYIGLKEAFGDRILNGEGNIDSKAMAALIFSNKDALEKVNAIVHPLVWQTIMERVQAAKEKLVVVEAALLSEKSHDIYDELWYVYTTRENRIRRLAESRGYSREKTISVMENQPSEKEFLQAAHWILDNNGTVDDLRRQLKEKLG